MIHWGNNVIRFILRFLFFWVLLFSMSLQAAPRDTKGKPGDDGNGGGAGGSKSISASDDFLTVKADRTASINVIKNSDSGFKITVTQILESLPNDWVELPTSKAKVFITESGDLTYDPNGAFDGVLQNTVETDSLTYTITDRYGKTATATVHVTIEGVKAPTLNQAPVPMPDTVTLNEDNSILIDVLVNDTDPDGDAVRLVSAGLANNGQVSIQNSQIFYQPDPDFNGIDSFSYTVTDEFQSTQALVSITVMAVNDVPIANTDSFTTQAGQVLLGNVLDNDSDIDGDTLSILSYATTTTQGGSVSMQVNGTFTYTPPAEHQGADSFSYVASDPLGATASATVNIEIDSASAVPYYVKALLHPEEWKTLHHPNPVGSGLVVTYAFVNAIPDYYPELEEKTWWSTVRGFTDRQQQVTRAVLAEIASFTDLNFVEVSSPNDAVMTFGLADFEGSTMGLGYSPYGNSPGTTDSDVWIDLNNSYYSGGEFIEGTLVYKALLHEIGHALGLDHPSDLSYYENNRQFTIMSYASHPGLTSSFATSYQLFDVATLQYLYGANSNFGSENNTFTFQQIRFDTSTIWDSSGVDKIDLSLADQSVNFDLRAGSFSSIGGLKNNVAIAFNVAIENLIGGPYDDRLVSNELDNILTGGPGCDTFVFIEKWGENVITDFVQNEDRLDFTALGLNLNDLNISYSNGDTVITYGNNKIILKNVSSLSSVDLVP